jgi:hypothetical protein
VVRLINDIGRTKVQTLADSIPPPAAPDGSRPVIPGKFPRMDRCNILPAGRMHREEVDLDGDNRADAEVTVRAFWDTRGTPDESDDRIVPELTGVVLRPHVRGDCRCIPESVVVAVKARATAGM